MSGLERKEGKKEQKKKKEKKKKRIIRGGCAERDTAYNTALILNCISRILMGYFKINIAG